MLTNFVRAPFVWHVASFRVIPSSHTWGLKYWGDITREPDEDIVTPMKLTDEAAKRLAAIDVGKVDAIGPGEAPTAEMLASQIEVPLRAGDALFFHSLTGTCCTSGRFALHRPIH